MKALVKEFSSTKRTELLESMARSVHDLFIIGGGITGAGIALDAATRGLSVAQVDMQDFAAGTSSRSTKLVHGGLRYLKQFEIRLVAEVGKERAIVYENAPHVTTPEWMLLPIYENGTFGKFSSSIGLRMYDFLAGVKKSERRKMLSIEETLNKVPLIKKQGLKGSGYYVEYKTDDARLTMEVIKEAVDHGAKAINYAEVTGFVYEHDKAVGVKIKDVISDKEYTVKAKKIINAAGPWVDDVRDIDRSKTGKTLKLTKGVHLVVDQSKLPLKQAVYFDTPDGRMVFAIPRAGKTYVGTTDTFYNGDPVQPKMTIEDRDYILEAIHYMFPEVQVKLEDVESSWAGVRPLIFEEGKSASEISRKDEIWTSPSGLLSIAGGKLTGYRKMAEMIVDLVMKQLKEEGASEYISCRTKTLPLSGGDVGGSALFTRFVEQKSEEAESYGFSKEEGEWLAKLYGSNIDLIFQLKNEAHDATRFNLPRDLFFSLLYGMKYEMVMKPEDYFIRRTGALFFDIQSVRKWKEQVIACMAYYLNWKETELQNYTEKLDLYILHAQQPIASDEE
ncbi:glycerol-3-phosphate dehydrogenase/oxidase [Bacillus horti]|uniref:Glycerol-3-phosphate dehydrogenase n=1 Tax=Caldalkalibacillus horti TaxID=77523 RepID=A0ABT9W322_9BACI|nr:glycerol-3-phosphate dehydrogenase/oxidase [Bacillus horti]MDQ0167643.1 glycerol-3-phosphate dehydrogenase [Bacillus horti]